MPTPPTKIALCLAIAGMATGNAAAQTALIDYDDGIPGNGIHEASVRNGGFEDGTANSGNITDIPPWESWFDARNNSGEGNSAQWWWDDGGVDDSDSSQISGWVNNGGGLDRRHLSQTIPAAAWPIAQGDIFALDFDAREGPGMDDDDEIEIEFFAFNGSSYTRFAEDRLTVPDDGSFATLSAGFTVDSADHDGKQIAFRLLVSGSTAERDEFAIVDNFHLGASRAGAPEPATLVARYLANGDTTDSSGVGNHGSAQGGLTFGAGFGVGSSFSCNGSDASVAIPHLAPASFSIAFWVKASAPGSEGTALAWWEGDGLVDGEVVGEHNDFGVSLRGRRVAFGVNRGSTRTLFSQTAVTDDRWHHVAVTRSSTSGAMQLYIDGVLEAAENGPTGNLDSPPNLRIGALQSAVRHFSGLIDEVSIYRGILTPEEVGSIYLPPGDTDGDSFDNGGEEVAGTCWGTASEFPQLVIRPGAGDTFGLEIAGKRGRRYRLLESDDLQPGGWSEHSLSDTLDEDGSLPLGTHPTDEGKKFFTSAIEYGTPERPNIVVIVIDDLGFADIGAYTHSASDVRTPNLDRLALSGVRCTSAYVTGPVCSPSRTGWLTGRHQSEWDPGSSWSPGLPGSVQTLAEMLTEEGYQTCKIGKNDLGTNLGDASNFSPRAYPGNHGYDRFLGFTAHAHDFWFHSTGGNNVNGSSAHAGPLQNHDVLATPEVAPSTRAFSGTDDPDNSGDPDYYLTKLLTDQALDFLTDHGNAPSPFFLTLSYNAVHHLTPQVPQSYLDAIGLELGVTMPTEVPHYDPTTNTTSNPSNYSNYYQYWNKVNNVGNANMRRYYLANLYALDEQVGRLLDHLDTAGIAEDTMIILFSDNGGPPETGANNGPLMGSKYNLFEGGIRVPFLISWPGKLPANREYDGIVSTLDIVPTCLYAAHGGLLPNLRGHSLIKPLKDNTEVEENRTLFWKWQSSNWAIRRGDWKLVHSGTNRSGNFTDQVYFDDDITGKLSLFNLTDSPSETSANDRIDEPENATIQTELQALWNAWESSL